MLTKIEAYSASGSTLALFLESGSGYFITDVEGLGPVKANIVSSTFATRDGSTFQNSRRGSRNIRISIAIEQEAGAAVVAQRRAALYAFFMPKRNVDLRIYLDAVHFATTKAHVESCEPDLFAKDPSLIISLICFDPDLISPTLVTVSGSSVSDSTEMAIPYSGTVETGITFKLYVDRTESNFTIFNRTPDGDIHTLEFITPLQASDVVTIVTIPGSKKAILTRASSDQSVLQGVSPSANWIQLYPGTNYFRVLINGVTIPYDLEYMPRYGGL